ncbi:MAG TPA: NBR1-Ig-like domain-containing protein [Longimicrobium sp.]
MAHFLQTFGHPRLTAGGAEIHLNAKELALLVFLRATGLPQARGAIGGLLWGKTSIGRNHSVNNAVSALRRVLPPGALPAGADPVALAADIPCDLDALCATADNAAAVQAVLAAYRAPFLDGFEFQVGEGAEAFVEWVIERREAYRRRLVELLEDACSRAEERGDRATLRALAAAGAERVAGWDAGRWLERARQGGVRKERGRVAILAVLSLVLAALLLRPLLAGGPPKCAAGRARAHLVRQIYPAEAKTAVREGERLTPTWFLKNVGECTWRRGARLVRVRHSGPAPLTADSVVERVRRVRRAVPPDSVLVLPIPMRGPARIGNYAEDWQLLDRAGRPVRLEDGKALQITFRRLPELPPCGPNEARAEILAQSHPGRENPMHPGQPFANSWTLVNRGECVWDGSLSLRFDSASGPRLSAPGADAVRVEERVQPSDAYTFSIPMRAPERPGSYRESWRFADGAGSVVPVSDAAAVDVHIEVFTGELRASAPECALGKAVASFLRSERVADGTVVRPGALVPKEWTLHNRGECTWGAGSLRLRFVRSNPEFAHPPFPDVPIDRDVRPSGTFTFRAPFHAPAKAGRYCIYWQLLDDADKVVRVSATDVIWADIVVGDVEVRGKEGC